MLAETTGASNVLYTYDNNGNTLSAMKDGTLVYSYTYGLFGTQDSYTNNAVQYTYYTYRPDGLRHSIGDTIHIWDGANIVADVNGTDITTYFRGINLIYAEEDGEQTYYHFNAHGDVVVLTNASGTKTKTYFYNAFGIEYNPGTYDTNPFRYCGEYYDTVSGTIYLRARYYNSDLGRFTQQDGWAFANPEDPLSLNLYTYCWNNPILYVDPSGCFVDAKYKYQSMNEGGVGGGGAAIFLLDKIAYGLGKIGEFFTNLANYIDIDNIAKLATNGDDVVENSFNEVVDQIEKTTNPPEPTPNEWKT